MKSGYRRRVTNCDVWRHRPRDAPQISRDAATLAEQRDRALALHTDTTTELSQGGQDAQ